MSNIIIIIIIVVIIIIIITILERVDYLSRSQFGCHPPDI